MRQPGGMVVGQRHESVGDFDEFTELDLAVDRINILSVEESFEERVLVVSIGAEIIVVGCDLDASLVASVGPEGEVVGHGRVVAIVACVVDMFSSGSET